jgi:hypothetical protein
LVEKSEGNRSPGRTRHIWEDNIKQPSINRMGAGSGLIWLTIGAGGGVLANAVMKLLVPPWNFLTVEQVSKMTFSFVLTHVHHTIYTRRKRRGYIAWCTSF